MIKRWLKRLLLRLLLDDPEVRAAVTSSALCGLKAWAKRAPPGTATLDDAADRQTELTVAPDAEGSDPFGEVEGV